MSEDLKAVLADLAPTGRLRAAINHGNVVLAGLNAESGEPFGISVDLARELARRLDVPIGFATFDAAGKVFAALDEKIWDIAFLAIDPARATGIDFTPPYVIIEGSYMVRNDSSLRTMDDFDRKGVRIAVGKGAAYDLYLSRALKHAELVRSSTSASAIDLFLDEKLDAVAGVRQPLVAYAASHPDLRVIDGSFTSIQQAMGKPKGGAAGLAYLRTFIEDVKANGFVAQSLARHKQNDAVVAPAGDAR
jgi:polar amino acid transport system substrate-binding protein